VRDVDGHVLVRSDVAGTEGWHRDTHHTAGRVSRGRGRNAGGMLPEPGEDEVRGYGDEARRPAEREEVGIAAAAAAQIVVRDQAAADGDCAADERVALLDEVGEELTDPEVPFETKCDWFPGPPPPPPVSPAVAKLGRGPAAWAAGVVVASLHAVRR